MKHNTIPNEVCIEIGTAKECMQGEILLAAVAVECLLYFFVFIFGVKVIDYIRRRLRGEKVGKSKIR